MNAPHSYAEWSKILGFFKEKNMDSDILVAMKQGSIEWQAGVAERFSKKLIKAVNARMNMASEKFQKDMDRSQGKESAIIQAILALRKEMLFILEAVDLPALPEKERKHYKNLVLEQLDAMQKSLENSAKTDRSGKMSSIVRGHKLNGL
jgi:hypothetical protein